MHLKLFDFAANMRARTRAHAIAGDRFLDRAAADSMTDRLSIITRTFDRGLWIGEQVAADIAPFAKNWMSADFDVREVLQTAGVFDIAVSLFSLQWVNDLPGALVQIRRLLRPDGLFIAALFGGNTLMELRQAFLHAETVTRGGISPRISPFADVRDAGSLLQRAGFALPVADIERIAVRYDDVFALARDLRAHAMTNVMAQRSRQALRRDTVAALRAHFAVHYPDDRDKMRTSFEILYLTGWAPDESQQKPLQPGTAKTRLADALGTEELSATEPMPRN